jgi:uncharacterized protein (DUF1015 family)
MSFVKPFCGTRYNPNRVPDPSEVAVLPYDCISDQVQDDYYRRHEYNAIRLIKAKTSTMDSGTDNQYTRATADFIHWHEDGVLVTDPSPAFYYYRLAYTTPDGATMLRKGFVGLMRIDEEGPDRVLPHEQVDSEPMADRLSLIKSTGANLSPIFVTYPDPDRKVLSLMAGALPEDPIIKMTYADGTDHSIWRITEPDILASISSAMENSKVMIADGHHRYAAAKEFRKMGRKRFPDAGPEAPFEYVLTYFSPMDEDGLSIQPTHRAVYGLSGFSTDEILLKLSKAFYIKEVQIDREDPSRSLAKSLETAREQNQEQESFVLAISGADDLFLLNFKKDAAKTAFSADVPEAVRSNDVAILQKIIFERVLRADPAYPGNGVRVEYFTDRNELFGRLESGAQLVFLLNPTRLKSLWAYANAGQLLPTKSTYFFPKVLAGLLIHKF